MTFHAVGEQSGLQPGDGPRLDPGDVGEAARLLQERREALASLREAEKELSDLGTPI